MVSGHNLSLHMSIAQQMTSFTGILRLSQVCRLWHSQRHSPAWSQRPRVRRDCRIHVSWHCQRQGQVSGGLGSWYLGFGCRSASNGVGIHSVCSAKSVLDVFADQAGEVEGELMRILLSVCCCYCFCCIAWWQCLLFVVNSCRHGKELSLNSNDKMDLIKLIRLRIGLIEGKVVGIVSRDLILRWNCWLSLSSSTKGSELGMFLKSFP